MKSISIILGSGFSIPEGIPGVEKINKFISELKDEDFMISSEMEFILLDGQQKTESFIHREDELFFIEFIEWYVINIVDEFNYENFYDFFTSFRRKNENENEITGFFKAFKDSKNIDDNPINGINSYLSRFSDYFNQLLYRILNFKEYYDNNGFGPERPYDIFIKYLSTLIENNYQVNIHTLNHDLFFDHIASKHVDLSKYFTDGFSEFGSEYFGVLRIRDTIYKRYLIRLKYFQNKFDKPLRLYKLHGSVDNYIADVSKTDLTRVKKDWKIGEMFKENKELEFYTDLYQNSYPDILSGANSKLAWYGEPYYADLQKHFVNNLKNAEILIIIGYGFGDSGINKKIEDFYMVGERTIKIIDPNEIKHKFSKSFNLNHIQKSIIDVSLNDFND